MKVIREVIRLRQELGFSVREVAEQVKIGKSTVGEIVADFARIEISMEEFKKMSDSTYLEILEQKRRKKDIRYDNLSELFEDIQRDLKNKGVTLKLLHKEYLEMEPGGYSYSRFCLYYQMWRKKMKLSMHLEHKAGDKMYVDYAGKKLQVYVGKDGKIQDLEMFVAILPASQLTYAMAVENQQKESFVRSNEAALHFFGGSPRAIVPDCLKSGVNKPHRYEPQINTLFETFSRHYGTAVLPARALKPQDKALVENAVNLVYQRVYAKLRNQVFHSLDELNKEIRRLIKDHNRINFQKRPVSRKDQFESFEKDLLRPLPSTRFEIKTSETRRVQKDYHVYLKHEDRYYSVPWKYSRKNVTIIADNRTVEIYHDNRRIALHIKNGSEKRYVTIKEHMPHTHRFIAELNEDKLLKWSQETGPETTVFAHEMFAKKAHPEQAYKALLGVLNLKKVYGKEAVEKACAVANKYYVFTYGFIKNFLKNNKHKNHVSVEETALPDNPTARGNCYYGG